METMILLFLLLTDRYPEVDEPSHVFYAAAFEILVEVLIVSTLIAWATQ